MTQMRHTITIALSKFTTKYRKSLGNINSVRMLKDMDYAWSIFRKVDAEGDADLVLLALNLKSQMCLFTSPPEKEAVAGDVPDVQEMFDTGNP